jgi:hypothetical protein
LNSGRAQKKQKLSFLIVMRALDARIDAPRRPGVVSAPLIVLIGN